MGDIPHAVTCLDIRDASFHSNVAALCTRAIRDWEGRQPDDVSVLTLSGGITNVLLLLTHRPTDDKAVVRVFGDNTEVLIDRERELRILRQLNSFGFGANILATFENGRVEAYLQCRTLTARDVAMPNVIPQIAARVARFHSAMVDESDKTSKLWRVVDKWLAMVKTLVFEDPDKAARFRKVDLDMMERELRATRTLCDSTYSPVVYSHNDLLPGNILVLGEPAPLDEGHLDVQLIDFEYSSYGYRGFDWGNHFNEWAGLECDYSRCPTVEQQRVFIQAYLESSSVRSVSPEQVAMAVAEANAFALASHIHWGIWALTQARYSPIDFDYFEYSDLRWAQYHRKKAAVVELVLQHFPPPDGEPAECPFPPAFPEALQEDIPIMPPVSTAPVVDGHVLRSL